MFISTWNDFEKSVERLCLENPSNVRYTMKYNHSKGLVEIKVTDNKKVSDQHIFCLKLFFFKCARLPTRLFLFFQCLQYRTELHQDLRKIDTFVLNFMRMIV